MSESRDNKLAQRGRSALRLGAVVIIVSTLAYYVMGCVCGMNAGYGKDWLSLDDDKWELSECFYSSVITLTTVGYTDLLGTELCELWQDSKGRHRWVSNTDGHADEGFDQETAQLEFNFSHWTRTLTGLQVILGISFFLYVIAQMTSFFVEGEYETLKRERRMRKQLARLQNHVIVCGAGDIATGVVERLNEDRVTCALIDSDDKLISRLQRQFPTVPCVNAEPTEPEPLQRLGLPLARGLITALNDDRLNLVGIVTARQSRADVRVITRAESFATAGRLKHAGADGVVCPSFLVGLRSASLLIRPTVVEFLDLFLQGDNTQKLVARGVVVTEASIAKTVGQLLGDGMPTVVAIQSEGQSAFAYNPSPQTPLTGGDKVALIGHETQVAIVESLLAGQLKKGWKEPPPSATDVEVAADTSASDTGSSNAGTSAVPTIPKFVVCGVGDTGIHILRELLVTNRPCVAIEASAERVRELRELFPDAHLIHGDAQDPDVLREAGIEEVRGLATMLPTERDNLVVAVTAKQLQPELRVVSAVGTRKEEQRLTRAGAEVVNRGLIGGRRLVAELLRPGVTTFMNQMLVSAQTVRFEAVVCGENGPFCRQPIDQSEIHRRCGLWIIALLRPSETVFVSHPSTSERFEPGTTLIVAGASSQVDALAQLVGDWE